MGCECPILCPECGGTGEVLGVGAGARIIVKVPCLTCSGDGEVCPADRDAYRAEHGPDC